jgi:2-iminobutanoate/2-iminopropanoate deaminase
MSRQPIYTKNAPDLHGPFSQGVQWDRLIYTSGQIGDDPATGTLISEDVQDQTRQILRNIQAILQEAGSDLDHVLKMTCFLTDISDFAAFNAAYREFFPHSFPARSTIEVGLVPPWKVEIEAIAVRPE